MTRSEAIKFVVVRSVGNFLLLMSLYGVLMTFGPVLYHEVQYRIIQARGVEFAVSASIPNENKQTTDSSASAVTLPKPAIKEPDFASILAGAKEQIIVPKDTGFSIVIPKLGASAKVFPNVDPGNPDAYKPILQKGVAHAKGTVFPGMVGNSYIFAHSADNWWDVGRYNAIFYLLKDLQKGDEVIIFFEDQRYDYVVSETFIAEASDVSLLTGNKGTEQLVLQTCWPPGTTLKRQFVIATPKKSI
jgi:LPXTG-site transpeptidase (sortase) family protein